MCIKQLWEDLAELSDAKIKINSHVMSLRDELGLRHCRAAKSSGESFRGAF